METYGRVFPPLPEMGKEEKWYGKVAAKAEQKGDLYSRSAYKVAQYVTCGSAPGLDWSERLKNFQHAINKHCIPIPPIDDDCLRFYEKLKDLVRAHAGPEALKLALAKDAELTQRKDAGELRFRLTNEAAKFFPTLIPPDGAQPEYFSNEDFNQLIALRNKWA